MAEPKSMSLILPLFGTRQGFMRPEPELDLRWRVSYSEDSRRMFCEQIPPMIRINIELSRIKSN